jgi:hypothetical protein
MRFIPSDDESNGGQAYYICPLRLHSLEADRFLRSTRPSIFTYVRLFEWQGISLHLGNLSTIMLPCGSNRDAFSLINFSGSSCVISGSLITACCKSNTRLSWITLIRGEIALCCLRAFQSMLEQRNITGNLFYLYVDSKSTSFILGNCLSKVQSTCSPIGQCQNTRPVLIVIV